MCDIEKYPTLQEQCDSVIELHVFFISKLSWCGCLVLRIDPQHRGGTSKMSSKLKNLNIVDVSLGVVIQTLL